MHVLALTNRVTGYRATRNFQKLSLLNYSFTVFDTLGKLAKRKYVRRQERPFSLALLPFCFPRHFTVRPMKSTKIRLEKQLFLVGQLTFVFLLLKIVTIKIVTIHDN